MAYSQHGLALALAGVVEGDTFLTVHDDDPGTTGANVVAGVDPQPATWGTPTDEVVAEEVDFVVPPAAGERVLSHFGVWAGTPGSGEFICGDELDVEERFSAAGGVYGLTAELVAASA